MAKECQLLLAGKIFSFFAYCEISDIFTGPTHSLLVMTLGHSYPGQSIREFSKWVTGAKHTWLIEMVKPLKKKKRILNDQSGG